MKYIAIFFIFVVFAKADSSKCNQLIDGYSFIADAINNIQVEFDKNSELGKLLTSDNASNSDYISAGKISYQDIKTIYSQLSNLTIDPLSASSSPTWIPSDKAADMQDLMLELHKKVLNSKDMQAYTAAQYEIILKVKREKDCAFLNEKVEQLPAITLATPEDANCHYDLNNVFDEPQDMFVLDNMQAIFQLNTEVAKQETIKQAEKRLDLIVNNVCSSVANQQLKAKYKTSNDRILKAKARGFDRFCYRETQVQEKVEYFDEAIEKEFGDNYTFGNYMQQQGWGQTIFWGLNTGINYWQTGLQTDYNEQIGYRYLQQEMNYENFLYTNCINPNIWQDIDLSIIETTDGLPLRSDQSNRDWRATGGWPNCNPDTVINPSYSNRIPPSNILPWSSLNTPSMIGP